MFWNKILFQDAMNFNMSSLFFLHSLLTFILLSILILVVMNFIFLITNKQINKNLNVFHKLEIFWTMLPSVLLLFIAIPSLKILYLTEFNYLFFLTLKVIGHQWYWTYELTDFNNMTMDSFMKNEESLNLGEYRLLDTENYISLPTNTPILCMVTSQDVIHSWSINSLMIKLDANPGILSQTYLISNNVMVNYGQCSEICGMNHSFMPIKLEFTTPLLFKMWMTNMQN